MKKIVVSILAVAMVLFLLVPSLQAGSGVKARTFENYDSNIATNLGTYAAGDVIYFNRVYRSGYTFRGWSLNDPKGKVVATSSYRVKGDESALDFYAQWTLGSWSDYGYYDGYSHPALDEALRVADKFSSEYPIDIQNAPYNLRTSFDKAYQRVANLRSKVYDPYYRDRYYDYDNQYLVDRYYERFGKYPTEREFYDYYGFDYYDYGTYGYNLRDAYYRKYGRYPTEQQFYDEYGFYEREYSYYGYRDWNRYRRPYDISYYNSEVKDAVDHLVDTIRDIALYYTGPIFRDYGNLPYITDGYEYEWDGYYGYVSKSKDKSLKDLINEANGLLKDKDRELYSEMYNILEPAIEYGEKTARGRGNYTTAIYDLEKAIERAEKFEIPSDKLLEPYMVGNTDGKFYPDKTLTRGELAVMLNRILGLGQTFSGSTWAELAAANLKGLGYLQGDPDGNLLLDKPVSMKEMATLLVRMKGYATIGGNVYSGRTTWATPYIQRAWAEGWLTDMNEVNPETLLTRGQVARMVNRAFKREMLPNAKSPVFSDVPKMHKYYHDIKAATTKAFVK